MFPKVKKKQRKNETNYLNSFRSRFRSFGFVRSPRILIKEKGTLITFPKVKKNKEKMKRITLIRFIQGSGRSDSSVRLGSLKKKTPGMFNTFPRVKKKKIKKRIYLLSFIKELGHS